MTANQTLSPFGGIAKLIQEKKIEDIQKLYLEKYQIDVLENITPHSKTICLYECIETGYKFWRPEEIAGDEQFYRTISTNWSEYYKTTRWEHKYARKHLDSCKTILEIGCGPGHFLKSLEDHKYEKNAIGIEFNEEAIANKVTKYPIQKATMEDTLNANLKFDGIYAFQVLEHVINPQSLISAAVACLNKNGILIFSTPNNENIDFQNQLDPLDLPPHHVGHFSAAVYKKIAKKFNLKIEKIYIQERKFAYPSTSHKTKNSLVHKLAKTFVVFSINLLWKIIKEPNSNILIVYRKMD